MASDSDFELWENTGLGRVMVWRNEGAGVWTHEPIRGGRTVALTPQERRYNQAKIATHKQDPFANGTLVNVTLVEGEPDNEKILANPNQLRDDDMAELVDGPWAKLQAFLDRCESRQVVQRMLAMATEKESSGKTVDRIQKRLDVLAPDRIGVGSVITDPDPHEDAVPSGPGR